MMNTWTTLVKSGVRSNSIMWNKLKISAWQPKTCLFQVVFELKNAVKPQIWFVFVIILSKSKSQWIRALLQHNSGKKKDAVCIIRFLSPYLILELCIIYFHGILFVNSANFLSTYQPGIVPDPRSCCQCTNSGERDEISTKVFSALPAQVYGKTEEASKGIRKCFLLR